MSDHWDQCVQGNSIDVDAETELSFVQRLSRTGPQCTTFWSLSIYYFVLAQYEHCHYRSSLWVTAKSLRPWLNRGVFIWWPMTFTPITCTGSMRALSTLLTQLCSVMLTRSIKGSFRNSQGNALTDLHACRSPSGMFPGLWKCRKFWGIDLLKFVWINVSFCVGLYLISSV